MTVTIEITCYCRFKFKECVAINIYTLTCKSTFTSIYRLSINQLSISLCFSDMTTYKMETSYRRRRIKNARQYNVSIILSKTKVKITTPVCMSARYGFDLVNKNSNNLTGTLN